MLEQEDKLATPRRAPATTPSAAGARALPAEPDASRPDATVAADARPAQADGLGRALARIVRGRAAASGPVLQRAPYIVQAGYMSGDMFGIAAALVLKPDAGVLILKETDPILLAQREEQSDVYRGFYASSLRRHGLQDPAISGRVKVVTVTDARSAFKALTSNTDYQTAFARAGLVKPRDWCVSPGWATGQVGERYLANSATATATIRKAWGAGGVGPSEEEMQAFLAERGIEQQGKYALLWVRLSAKRKAGGAHPELDTSVQGVRDLKKAITERTDRKVVIIGDRPNKADVLKDTVDMVEFWKKGVYAAHTGLDGRIAQLRLFEYMAREGYDLISIGMRSGAMEGPALLGIPTVYIEDVANQQHERMEKWLGKVPGWNQARLDTLPTRTGRRAQTGSVAYRELVRRADNAVAPVKDYGGGGFHDIKRRLEDNYGATAADTERGFITDSLWYWRRDLPPSVTNYATYVRDYERGPPGSTWSAELRLRIATWHGERTRLATMAGKLAGEEATIARILGAGSGWVRARLDELWEVATDDNVGLADFVRVAVAKFGAGSATDVGLRGALGRWRSAYNGKDLLKKGFEDTDRDKVMTKVGDAATRAKTLREASDARLAEKARLAELARLAEVRRVEQARLAEEARLRLAEEARLAEQLVTPEVVVQAVVTEVVKKKRTHRGRGKKKGDGGGQRQGSGQQTTRK